jgi:hypothetical protein
MTGESFADRVNRVTNGFMEAKIVMAGVELKLYDRLSSGAATAAELAADLQVTRRGIEVLCDALAALGYLAKTDGRYANAAGTEQYLVRGQPDSFAFITAHRNHMYGGWSQLEEVIRHGKQERESDKPTLADVEINRNFILAMAEVSRERQGAILDRLPLAAASLFVDLGGGPAHYCCEAVQRHPALRALLVDLPLTTEVAREYIAGRGLADRVATRVINFYTEDRFGWDEPADGVLISQVLHAEGADENRALLHKVCPNVRPGGWVAIVENPVDEGRTTPVPGAMFAVNMLASTARGRTYTEAEMAGWLTDAGFEPQPGELVAPRTLLILARKLT